MLARHPNRLLTRNQILDEIAGPDAIKSDRNVDFLINRLRSKLADDARAPRYIATRYGEGYVWIGRDFLIHGDQADAYLIVGPLHGLDWDFGAGLAHSLLLCGHPAVSPLIDISDRDEVEVESFFKWLSASGDSFSQVAGFEVGVRLIGRFPTLEPMLSEIAKRIRDEDTS